MTKIVENNSGLLPQGVAVLCAAYEPEIKLMSETIFIPDQVRESLKVLENRMVVLALGGDAWADEQRPRAAVGDVVLVTKHAGTVATGADGGMYRLVNCRDIYCVIDTEMFDRMKDQRDAIAKGIRASKEIAA